MNKSEGKGYKWLLKQGYKEEDVVFQRKGIDFICADGKGYEVKKLYGHIIWFHKGQLDRTKAINNTVLVFDEKEDPIAVLPSMELEEDKVISGIKITVVRRENNEGYGVVSLKKEVIAEIQKGAKESKMTNSAFISMILTNGSSVKKKDMPMAKEGGLTKQDLDTSLLGLESDLDMKMREMLKEVTEKM